MAQWVNYLTSTAGAQVAAVARVPSLAWELMYINVGRSLPLKPRPPKKFSYNFMKNIYLCAYGLCKRVLV